MLGLAMTPCTGVRTAWTAPLAGGRDILNGGAAGEVHLYGDAYRMYQNSVGGDDILNGGHGYDTAMHTA
jgi:hypothetical protein